MESKREYVERYYKSYGTGEVDEEVKTTGAFLAENAKGVILDCGCGPVPQLWSIFMPQATEIQAIDLPEESISFVKDKLQNVEGWQHEFKEYQNTVEQIVGQAFPEDYIPSQVRKLKNVQQADMATSLPFPDEYFDTAISLYSLGCLKDPSELEQALENIKRVLKPGGKLLHINTDGENKNDILPAYTWNGMSQSSKTIVKTLEEKGFENIKVIQHQLPTGTSGMYVYSAISLLSADK